MDPTTLGAERAATGAGSETVHVQQASQLTAVTLVAGSASRRLASLVERELGLRFAGCTIERFPDGEVSVRVDEPVRGRDVILLAATSPPVNDHLVELLAIADACRRADAARIVALVPYFGYARSDRRDGRRTPIMASLVADLIERAGIDHVVTTDVHTPALEGFFRIPVDNLTAVPVIAAWLRARASRHAVLAPGALDRIAAAGVRAMVVTDSIEPRDAASAPFDPEVVSIAPLLATAIRRLLDGGSLR